MSGDDSAENDFLQTLRIRAVLERYCSLLDSGAVNDLLGLFADDCVFTMMGRTYEGKAEFGTVWAGGSHWRARRRCTPWSSPTSESMGSGPTR